MCVGECVYISVFWYVRLCSALTCEWTPPPPCDSQLTPIAVAAVRYNGQPVRCETNVNQSTHTHTFMHSMCTLHSAKPSLWKLPIISKRSSGFSIRCQAQSNLETETRRRGKRQKPRRAQSQSVHNENPSSEHTRPKRIKQTGRFQTPSNITQAPTRIICQLCRRKTIPDKSRREDCTHNQRNTLLAEEKKQEYVACPWRTLCYSPAYACIYTFVRCTGFVFFFNFFFVGPLIFRMACIMWALSFWWCGFFSDAGAWKTISNGKMQIMFIIIFNERPYAHVQYEERTRRRIGKTKKKIHTYVHAHALTIYDVPLPYECRGWRITRPSSLCTHSKYGKTISLSRVIIQSLL